jgi:hypothetical protein
MHQMWRTEPNGDFSSTMLNLRLIVHQGDRFSRFLLLECCHDSAGFRETLLESGCEDNVHAAKEKALEKAIRRVAPLRDGLRGSPTC